MFLDFFLLLKTNGLPVSLKEYLSLLDALDKEIGAYSTEDFYYLCRTILIKDEKYLDRFDIIFSHYFKGTEVLQFSPEMLIPEEWLTPNRLLNLTDEEKALIEAMGGLDKLMERFEELLNTQKERHEGGNRQIGTGGTSPFGANGYNPEGFRIGQESGRNRSAIKIWDQRNFKNFDDHTELNTRNFKMALRRLRVFTREGFPDELNIDGTIHKTAHNGGILDLEMMPSRQNKVKVLLFLDVGGSMDEHSRLCSELFSAAKYEFKHLEYFYFHNCIYENLWKDNTRRQDRISTMDVLHKYNSDYKVIIVGDGYMSPYEITQPAGSVEHYNDEPGMVWLQRIKDQYPFTVWLNPSHYQYWDYATSIKMLRRQFDNRMFPLTLEGITLAMKALKNRKLTF
ncbi:MAG: VWA domain-containing protein [Sphingobacteriales bacterium]|nr:MAG: VWA domain-containing protein [Sphingobacteriales bacterium]